MASSSGSTTVPRLQVELPTDIPKHVTWRGRNVLTPVRDQGHCNCCWAMAATRAIESRVAIRNRVAPVQLSVQELINCVKHDPKEPDRRDCYSGSINLAFRWIIKHGILREDECPFVGHKQPCNPKPQLSRPLKIKDYSMIRNGDEAELLRYVSRHPVAAVVWITKALKDLAAEEIYEGPADGDFHMRLENGDMGILQHAIVIVGYGTRQSDQKNYWEICNSWGTEWADHGYGKVMRDSSLRPGQPSLITQASYPILLD